MFIVGFVTADEAVALTERGYEVEDASNYGLVSPSTEHRIGDDLRPGVAHESYLMAKPEPGPDCTQAVAIFVDASVYDMLKADLLNDVVLTAALDISIKALIEERAKLSTPPADNSLSVTDWIERRNKLWMKGNALRADAENFKYCSHKHPDGSDARYPTGNGETACICGNKWD